MQSLSPKVQEKIKRNKAKNAWNDYILDLIVKDISGTITPQERAILSSYQVC